MDAEVDHYGYRLKVVRTGPGWTVYIHSPGSRFGFDAMKTTRDSDDRDMVIAEAKAFVDAHMRKAVVDLHFMMGPAVADRSMT